jgi:hypothetical protein
MNQRKYGIFGPLAPDFRLWLWQLLTFFAASGAATLSFLVFILEW